MKFNNKKYEVYGKYALGVLFILSVLLNLKQNSDKKLKEQEIDFLIKELVNSKELNLILKNEWEKKSQKKNSFGFDIDSTTNEVILKRLQSEKLNTK